MGKKTSVDEGMPLPADLRDPMSAARMVVVLDRRIDSNARLSMPLSALLFLSVCFNVFQMVREPPRRHLAQELRSGVAVEIQPLPPGQVHRDWKEGPPPAYTPEYEARVAQQEREWRALTADLMGGLTPRPAEHAASSN